MHALLFCSTRNTDPVFRLQAELQEREEKKKQDEKAEKLRKKEEQKKEAEEALKVWNFAS